jgi:hypothetical protein
MFLMLISILISIIYMINIISQRFIRAPLFRHSSFATTSFDTNNLRFPFSKKVDYKKSKPEHQKMMPRDPLAHIDAP